MRIELFAGRDALLRRTWHFRIRAGNGETVAQSEGYRRKIDCRGTAEMLKACLQNAEITEGKR